MTFLLLVFKEICFKGSFTFCTLLPQGTVWWLLLKKWKSVNDVWPENVYTAARHILCGDVLNFFLFQGKKALRRIENELQPNARCTRGRKEAHQNVMIVEQTSKNNLLGTYWMIHIVEDNTLSVISALYNGLQLIFSQRDAAQVQSKILDIGRNQNVFNLTSWSQ